MDVTANTITIASTVTDYVSGVINGINSATWVETSSGSTYYRSDFDLGIELTGNDVVVATVINAAPALAAACWIITVVPNEDTIGNLRVILAGDPTGSVNMDIAWIVKQVPPP